MKRKVLILSIGLLGIIALGGCKEKSTDVVENINTPTASLQVTETPSLSPESTVTPAPTQTAASLKDPKDLASSTVTMIPVQETPTPTPVSDAKIKLTASKEGEFVTREDGTLYICTDVEKQIFVNLPDYSGLKLKPVTDEELEDHINGTLESYLYEIEKDGPAFIGDCVYLFFKGSIDGVPFEGGTYETEPGYPLLLGSGNFIEGFEDQLVGVSAGDNVNVYVTFPKNYGVAELNGKEALFECTILSVTEVIIPELNDEFVYDNFGYSSVEEYREAVRSDIEEINYLSEIYNYLDKYGKTEGISTELINEKTLEKYDEYMNTVNELAEYYELDPDSMLFKMYGISSSDYLMKICGSMAEYEIRVENLLKAVVYKENIPTDEKAIAAWFDKEYEYYDISLAAMLDTGILTMEDVTEQYFENAAVNYFITNNLSK